VCGAAGSALSPHDLCSKGPPPGHRRGPLEGQLLAGVDGSEGAQENLLLEAIKALSAEEICANTLENIPLTLAASGWRSTAALLTHAARCADAGDFLNAERNRQRARELLIKGNDAFRQFQEARAAEGASIWAEAFEL
jgi:hypothetical protein